MFQLLAGNVAEKLLDPLDDSNSLADLAQNLHAVQQSAAATASASADEDTAAAAAAAAASLQPVQHGPLVQLLHKITASTSTKPSVIDETEASPGQESNNGVETAEDAAQVNGESQASGAESDERDQEAQDAVMGQTQMEPELGGADLQAEHQHARLEPEQRQAEADQVAAENTHADVARALTALQPDAEHTQDASLKALKPELNAEGISNDAPAYDDESEVHASATSGTHTGNQPTSTAQPAVA